MIAAKDIYPAVNPLDIGQISYQRQRKIDHVFPSTVFALLLTKLRGTVFHKLKMAGCLFLKY